MAGNPMQMMTGGQNPPTGGNVVGTHAKATTLAGSLIEHARQLLVQASQITGVPSNLPTSPLMIQHGQMAPVNMANMANMANPCPPVVGTTLMTGMPRMTGMTAMTNVNPVRQAGVGNTCASQVRPQVRPPLNVGFQHARPHDVVARPARPSPPPPPPVHGSTRPQFNLWTPDNAGVRPPTAGVRPPRPPARPAPPPPPPVPPCPAPMPAFVRPAGPASSRDFTAVPFQMPPPPPPTEELRGQLKRKRLEDINLFRNSASFKSNLPTVTDTGSEPDAQQILDQYQVTIPRIRSRDLDLYLESYYDKCSWVSQAGSKFYAQSQWAPPDILKFLLAVLTMSQVALRDFSQATFSRSGDGQSWMFMEYVHDATLAPAGTFRKDWFHLSTVAGLFGIAIKGKVLPQFPWTDENGRVYPFEGFFALGHDAGNFELPNVLSKLRFFGKNQTDVAVFGDVVGLGVPFAINGGQVQTTLAESLTYNWGNCKSHKLCIRASAARVKGFAVRLEGAPPSGWNPREPFEIPDC